MTNFRIAKNVKLAPHLFKFLFFAFNHQNFFRNVSRTLKFFLKESKF